MRQHGDSSTTPRSGVDVITWKELLSRVPTARFTRGLIPSDLSHRDPTDDLQNIEDGKFIAALDQLPSHIKDMWMSTDVHVELVETEAGHQQITKIIKKREPGFAQGKETFWGLTADGTRCPLSEDEFDEITGGRENPDDVYKSDEVEFVQVDREYSAPLDPWDVVFDATEFQQHLLNLRKRGEDLRDAAELLEGPREDWKFSNIIMDRLEKLEASDTNPEAYLSNLKKFIQAMQLSLRVEWDNIYDRKDKNGRIIPGALTTMVYSADFFPYPVDKRIRSARAREIVDTIKRQNLTKQQVGKMIGRQVDRRPALVAKTKADALKMPLSKRRGQILIKAQNIEACIRTAAPRHEMSQSDVRKIWETWQRRNIEVNGSCNIPSWQYRRFMVAKYQKLIAAGEITRELASKTITVNMERLYGDKREVYVPEPSPTMETNPPDWLPELLGGEEVTEEDVAAIPIFVDDPPFGIEEEHDWLENNLLSGGRD